MKTRLRRLIWSISGLPVGGGSFATLLGMRFSSLQCKNFEKSSIVIDSHRQNTAKTSKSHRSHRELGDGVILLRGFHMIRFFTNLIGFLESHENQPQEAHLEHFGLLREWGIFRCFELASWSPMKTSLRRLIWSISGFSVSV